MKIEKEKDARIGIRISEEDKLLLDYVALKNGTSTSDYLRLCIDTVILPYKRLIQIGELNYDDIKAICNNIIQQRKLFKS